MMPSGTPLLSVVLVASDARKHTERALQSLFHQNIIDKMEIIVLDCALADMPPIAGANHPAVCVVRVEPDADFGAIRALGVRMAQAPVVVLFEEHSFAMPGWAAAMVAAHEGPWSAVGGEEYSAAAGEGLSDAAYLEHCIRWMPPAPRGESEALPTHGTSFKREVLLSCGENLGIYLICLPLLYWKLTAEGHRMYVEPDARYMHTYVATPGTLISHILWSRIFGHQRATLYQWPASKRVVRFIASPVLPFVRTARLGTFIASQRRDRLWLFLYMSPAIFLIEAVGIIGETLGLLFGAGKARQQFSRRHARAVGLI